MSMASRPKTPPKPQKPSAKGRWEKAYGWYYYVDEDGRATLVCSRPDEDCEAIDATLV